MARKPKRTPLTAHVSVGHQEYTGMAEIASAEDVRYVRVQVPGLAWLDHVDLDFVEGTAALTITVKPVDDNAPMPKLRVGSEFNTLNVTLTT